MALEILNAKKAADNGLLSKIQIGGKTYEIKDLIARENAEALALLIDALSAKVGNVAEGTNLADIIKNIQENAYDDTEIQNAIKALQEADLLKADKTQVATDIAAAVKAEADIARAAEKANADEIARVDAALKLAVENDVEGIDSIKELATWVNTHGAAAENMSKAITKNAEDIAAMDEAYKAADVAIDGRLDVIEAALGDGEGSVADQIADAKAEAIDAAKDYTDGRDTQSKEVFAPIILSCIITEFLTMAPFSTLTPRNKIEFSTTPSMTQPSEISEFFTTAFSPYLVGALSRTFV